MAQAAKAFTRRAFLSAIPAVSVAAVPAVAVAMLKTPQDRITEHLDGLREAWAEIYGEPPRVAEFNHKSRFILVAGRPDDFA